MTKVSGVENPQFLNEPAYRQVALPDPGFQLLALYRFWNMAEYWFPYRDIIGENWPDVLRRSIAPIALAKSGDEYKVEMMRFIAALHDTHANLWSSLGVRPPQGDCELPVTLRFIENRPVVWAYRDEAAGPKSGLRPGDAILAMDGRAAGDMVQEWSPLYAASNEPTRLRDIGRRMPAGACGPVKLKIERAGEASEISAQRLKSSGLDRSLGFNHDSGGEPFRLLSPEVAYVRIGALKKADIPRFMEMAKATRGMVIDIRNYPAEFPIFELGGRLTAAPVYFAVFTVCDLGNPGAFHFRAMNTIQPLRPIPPRYTGKVAIVVDESTQSSAEYHAMAFRAAGGVVVGSTTAAADGNVSRIVLPGGLSSMFSGIGVFYPDHKPTQRVGIVADVAARPTIAGVAAGRDEVLEAAIRAVLGEGAAEAEIRRMAKR